MFFLNNQININTKSLDEYTNLLQPSKQHQQNDYH